MFNISNESRELSRRIASNIKELRLERGLTQTELAELAHTKQPSIARLEGRDGVNFRLATIIEVADCLDCRLDIRFVRM